MQSILATQGTFQKRKEYIENQLDQLAISKFDRIFLHAENSVKIEQIRYLIRELHKKPFGGPTPGVKTSGVSRSGSPDVESLKSPLRAGIILEAEKATIEAQNALLKLLEEPPKSARLFLSAPNPQYLLPTIVSRCTIKRLHHETLGLAQEREKEIKQIFEVIKDITPGDALSSNAALKSALELAEELGKTRQSANQFLQDALLYTRQQYLKKSGALYEVNSSALKKYANIALKLLLSRRLISANVNSRQVLENLFLDL